MLAPPEAAPVLRVPERHLAESREFTPSGLSFSSEQNDFGAEVRAMKSSHEVLRRFHATLRFGGTPDCGVPYGIGSYEPALYVRRHIRSAAASEGLPPQFLPELPSAAPALVGTESGFDNGAVNEKSGAQGAMQYMQDQWGHYKSPARPDARPNNLEDLTAFLGGFLADGHEYLKRKMGERTRVASPSITSSVSSSTYRKATIHSEIATAVSIRAANSSFWRS